MKKKIININFLWFIITNVLLYVFYNTYTAVFFPITFLQNIFNGFLLNNLDFVFLLDTFLFKHELLPLSLSIFLIGFIGFLESREFLTILVNTEIIMLGLNFYLITNSLLWGDFLGQVFALCFLAVTAAETAIGLGLLILLYRAKGKVSFAEYSVLKG